ERVTKVVKSDGPDAMRALLRGGAARRLLVRGERLAQGESALAETRTAARSADEDALSRLANDAKDAAAQCIAAAQTRLEAEEARAAYLLASDYLGAPIRCVTDRDCAPGKLCRTSTAECLVRGVYCRGPEDCAPGSECSGAHDECVRRDGFRCQRTEQCRVGEACQTGTDTCVELEQIEGSACEVKDDLVKGLCRTEPGKWTNAGERLECRPTIQPGQRTDDNCNGLDDNCDGSIDESFQGGGPCDVSTGTVQGECVHGQTVCLEGHPDCRPSARNPVEICGDDKDNDCNGKTDDGCAPIPQKEVCDGVDNDLNGVADDRIDCHAIVVTFNDVDDDAVVWRGETNDDSKVCSVSRAAGGMGSCNLNQRALAAGISEPSSRYIIKLGNGGCWNSSGSITITVDGTTVLNQSVSHAVRHCGWFYRVTFDVNLARAEFSLVETRDCGLPTDCM
ncbi:MAG TPA: MopE-related protein, partial [Polyangiales bacterium]